MRRVDQVIEPPLGDDAGAEIAASRARLVHLALERVGEEADREKILLQREAFAVERLVPRILPQVVERVLGGVVDEIFESGDFVGAGREQRQDRALELFQAGLVGVDDLAVVDVELLRLLRPVLADVLFQPLPDARQIVGQVIGVRDFKRAAPDDQRPKQRPVPRLVNPRQNHVAFPAKASPVSIPVGEYSESRVKTSSGACVCNNVSCNFRTREAVMTQMSQVDLLNEYATRRDAEAFAKLVDQYQRLIFSTCRRKLHNSQDVDDAVQETFLRLAHKAGELHSNIGGWLHRCAVNVSVDMNRRRQARQKHEHAAAAETPVGFENVQVELAELREHLDSALEKLDAEQRELIIQRFFVGRPQVEMARGDGRLALDDDAADRERDQRDARASAVDGDREAARAAARRPRSPPRCRPRPRRRRCRRR